MTNQYTSKKAKNAAAKAEARLTDRPRHIVNLGIATIPLTPQQAEELRTGKKINPCTQKAIDQNLPHFTLLPSDNFTPVLVKQWVALATQYGTPQEKIIEAKHLLATIEKWRTDHPTACKTPD